MDIRSDFLDQKLSLRFHAYDLNKDGYIERADLEKAASRISEAFGLKPGEARRTRLFDLFLGIWNNHLAAADRDGDGRITENEYKAAFASRLLETPAHFDQGYAMPFVNLLMDIADSDGDGRLTHAEYMRWLTSLLHLSTTDAMEIARHWDHDGDGYITRSEILDAIRDHYFNEDPQSVGSWFHGSLNHSGDDKSKNP